MTVVWAVRGNGRTVVWAGREERGDRVQLASGQGAAVPAQAER